MSGKAIVIRRCAVCGADCRRKKVWATCGKKVVCMACGPKGWSFDRDGKPVQKQA